MGPSGSGVGAGTGSGILPGEVTTGEDFSAGARDVVGAGGAPETTGRADLPFSGAREVKGPRRRTTSAR